MFSETAWRMWRCSFAISHSDTMGWSIREGRDAVQKNLRTGRPLVENNTLQLLVSLLDTDRRWTARELAAKVGMYHKTVHDILAYRYGQRFGRVRLVNERFRESFLLMWHVADINHHFVSACTTEMWAEGSSEKSKCFTPDPFSITRTVSI